MSEPKRELSIYRYPDIATRYEVPYQLHAGLNFRDFSLAQDAFDFCADRYPGEPVTVDIRPRP